VLDLTAKALPQLSRDTMLLKRVHRLPMPFQERLLVFLDETKAPSPFLISTASDSIEKLAASAQLLPELVYRLSAYRIWIPPLRERRQDIPDLFLLMLNELASQTGASAPVPEPRAFDLLMDYSWPGNLRELQNTVREYLLEPDSALLAMEIGRRQHSFPGNPVCGRGAALKEQVKQASKRVEGEIILRALEQNRWNRRRTAEVLRISYRSLMYKMKNCNIRAPLGRIGWSPDPGQRPCLTTSNGEQSCAEY